MISCVIIETKKISLFRDVSIKVKSVVMVSYAARVEMTERISKEFSKEIKVIMLRNVSDKLVDNPRLSSSIVS